MVRKIAVATSLLLCTLPAWAKNAAQAVADMESVSDTDPNGFKLMIVCIGLLVLVAGSLIAATIVYGMKHKKTKQ